jgi:hypothetical protein
MSEPIWKIELLVESGGTLTHTGTYLVEGRDSRAACETARGQYVETMCVDDGIDVDLDAVWIHSVEESHETPERCPPAAGSTRATPATTCIARRDDTSKALIAATDSTA